MQPTLNLLAGDLAALDVAVPSAAADADTSTAAFANLLGLRITAAADTPSPGGDLLPQVGKDLPIWHPPLDADTGAFTDPEHIVWSLNRQLTALEGLADPIVENDSVTEVPEITPLAAIADEILAEAMPPQADRAPVVLPPSPGEPAPPVSPTPSIPPAPTGELIATVSRDPRSAAAPLARSLTEMPAPQSNRLPAGAHSLSRDLRPDTSGSDRAAAVLTQNTGDSDSKAKQSQHPVVIGSAEESPAMTGGSQTAKPQPASPPFVPQATPDIALTVPSQARVSTEPPSVPASPLPTTTIQSPLQEPGWGDAFSQRITLMANSKLQNAEIRLTPAELGPLRVRLTIEDGAANITFSAQHAATREAIEQALPRLREMLAENGLSLEQASVGDDGVAQGYRDDEWRTQDNPDTSVHDDPDPDLLPGENAHRKRSQDGLVDTFV